MGSSQHTRFAAALMDQGWGCCRGQGCDHYCGRSCSSLTTRSYLSKSFHAVDDPNNHFKVNMDTASNEYCSVADGAKIDQLPECKIPGIFQTSCGWCGPYSMPLELYTGRVDNFLISAPLT